MNVSLRLVLFPRTLRGPSRQDESRLQAETSRLQSSSSRQDCRNDEFLPFRWVGNDSPPLGRHWCTSSLEHIHKSTPADRIPIFNSQVSGANRLSDLVQDIWTPDVKANQLSDVISGIAPIKSVVNVGSGFANLILLPIEQYRKDGKIARGIQKGISNFNKTATLEALSVGARLATGTQVILEHVEKVLGGRFVEDLVTEASGSQGTGEFVGIETMSDEERVELISRYAEQPGDLREGVEKAYKSLGDNLRSAAQTILAVPMDVYERSGSEVSHFLLACSSSIRALSHFLTLRGGN